MTKSKDEHDAHEEAWPFEEVLMAGRTAARARQQRFLDYVADTDPSLSAALASEAARFDVLTRTVIEPAMREVADEVMQRGWHVSVVRDDDLDRLAPFATPGIRFYCSRRPPRIATDDWVWPPAFVAFFGCAQIRAVRTHVELDEVDTGAAPFHDETPLPYLEVTRDAVRALLVAFLDHL